MANIERYPDHQEFYAEFYRVDGELGSALVFVGDDENLSSALAHRIAGVIDQDEQPESDSRCQVVIPGLGQCEVEQRGHKYDGLGRDIHVVGPCSWNGGLLIEVSDDALLDEARNRATE